MTGEDDIARFDSRRYTSCLFNVFHSAQGQFLVPVRIFKSLQCSAVISRNFRGQFSYSCFPPNLEEIVVFVVIVSKFSPTMTNSYDIVISEPTIVRL